MNVLLMKNKYIFSSDTYETCKKNVLKHYITFKKLYTNTNTKTVYFSQKFKLFNPN